MYLVRTGTQPTEDWIAMGGAAGKAIAPRLLGIQRSCVANLGEILMLAFVHSKFP